MSKIAVNLDSDSIASQLYLQETSPGAYRLTISAMRGSCTVVVNRADLQAIYCHIRDTLADSNMPVLTDRLANVTFDNI